MFANLISLQLFQQLLLKSPEAKAKKQVNFLSPDFGYKTPDFERNTMAFQCAILLAAFLMFTSNDGSPVQSDGKVVVETRYGSIQGVIRRFPDINKPIKAVNKFLGIPYAAPPTGELRFKPPQQLSAWKPKTYNASYFKSICVQPPEYNVHFWPKFSHPESEDCLYLNIYTPVRNNSSAGDPCPVMVYIHGGGYEVGTPMISPGDVIPLWEVVLVTIQYRLGPFGFVTTGDSVAPGNYGMLDQIEALQWVQENIKAFGGDPSRVTIFGESAGGSSVGLLVLSPLSKGLFHRAIAVSGVELSPYAIGSNTTAVKHTKDLASSHGCPVEESDEIIKCLRSTEARKLLGSPPNVWRPVVDGHFLLDTPENLRKSGTFNRVTFMAGFTSQEGAYFFPSHIDNVAADTFRRNVDFALTYILNKYGQMWTPESKIPDSLLDAVLFMNTPWPYARDEYKLKRGFSDIVTDSCVAEPTHASLLSHSKQEPSYMYEFAYRSELNPAAQWLGVRHKDDTPYQFGFPLMNLTILQNYDEADRNISDLIITLFTNFAKYGNPTPEPVRGASWEKFNSSHRVYLRIQESPLMATNYYPTKMAFWSEYYKKLLTETKCPVLAMSSRGTTCKVVQSNVLVVIHIIVVFLLSLNIV